jgi:hypothetical protein
MLPMKIQSITTIAAGLLLAGLALQEAQAQSKPAKLVTRDELRVCMNSEATLATRRQGMDARKAKFTEEAAAIRAEGEELKTEQERLESRNESMDRFNRRVKTHNARIKTAQDEAAAYRADLEDLNKGLLTYNEQCGGISFLSEDKEAILKEREAGKK